VYRWGYSPVERRHVVPVCRYITGTINQFKKKKKKKKTVGTIGAVTLDVSSLIAAMALQIVVPVGGRVQIVL
jgi:hypothetical protein